jgi:hypothetical protein
MIGFASFPTVTDSTENTRTTVSLNSDFNQKIDYKADITKIILEKDDPWRYIRWTLVIVASLLMVLFLLGVLALAMYNPGG